MLHEIKLCSICCDFCYMRQVASNRQPFYSQETINFFPTYMVQLQWDFHETKVVPCMLLGFTKTFSAVIEGISRTLALAINTVVAWTGTLSYRGSQTVKDSNSLLKITIGSLTLVAFQYSIILSFSITPHWTPLHAHYCFPHKVVSQHERLCTYRASADNSCKTWCLINF